MIAVAVAMAATQGLTLPVQAQEEQDADLSLYCRTVHPNSSPQKIGLTHYCQEPGTFQGATRHPVDLAEACRLTMGRNASARRGPGSRVICTATSADATAEVTETASGPPDFQAYCRETFPNSSYEKRAEPWGVIHYCRRPGATGGFTLQPIDLADACEHSFATRQYEVSSSAVSCGGEVAMAGEPEAERPGPGPGAPNRPDVPEWEPFPEPLPWPEDEAEADPEAPDEPQSADTQEAEAAEAPDMALACHALGGQWQSGTVALAEDILSETERSLAEVYCAGEYAELCRMQAANNHWVSAYFQVHMHWQCHAAFVRHPASDLDDIVAAREEGCTIRQMLEEVWDKASEAGATMDQGRSADQWLEIWEMDTLCAEATVRFVGDQASAGGAAFDAAELPYSEPIFVEVEFDRSMNRSSRTVHVSAGTQTVAVEVFQVSPHLYRSTEPIMLEPVDDADVRP